MSSSASQPPTRRCLLEKVLYLDDRHGVADMDLDAANPTVLFAALWRFERKPWTFTSGGEEGGVYRSVDGGTTWKTSTWKGIGFPLVLTAKTTVLGYLGLRFPASF